MNKYLAIRKLQWFSLICLVTLFSCNPTSQKPEETENKKLQIYFDKYELSGSFILYDLNNNRYMYVNPDQKDMEFIPASTFKICNSLIGLETGVIEDENFTIPWDSIDRGYESWNQDQTLATALKYSAVWYYQELARRVGEERMQELIDKANYGNKKIGGGIDLFWLRGDLRITPSQQIEFLKDLYFNQLPFSIRNQEIVKKIMIVEETDNYIMHAKTGWALKNSVGWYVGYIEKEDNVYFFVTCVQGDDFNMEDFGRARIEISRQILSELKII